MVRGSVTAARYGFGIEWSPFGGFNLVDMRGAYFTRQHYMYFTVREACRMFRAELRGAA